MSNILECYHCGDRIDNEQLNGIKIYRHKCKNGEILLCGETCLESYIAQNFEVVMR